MSAAPSPDPVRDVVARIYEVEARDKAEELTRITMGALDRDWGVAVLVKYPDGYRAYGVVGLPTIKEAFQHAVNELIGDGALSSMMWRVSL